MLAYAAADTAFLEDLAAGLRHRLEDLGRWSWALEECSRLTTVRHAEVDPDPLMFERIKGARALKGQARDRIFDLFWWRDGEAQRLDLPPFKVLGNKPMVELAQRPPSSGRELSEVDGLGHRFARRWGREVLRRIRDPRKAPRRVRNDHSPGPNAEQRRRIDGLTAVRDEVATELGLPGGLVCPKALVAALATSPRGADGMADAGLNGWRSEVLADRFAEILTEDQSSASKSNSGARTSRRTRSRGR
jgi:ribonuclease D